MILKNFNTAKYKLQQVFLYVTGRCNASCVMCYLFGNYYGHKDVPLSVAINYLKKYKEMGAYRVTFLGGEPTLHPELGQIIVEAKNIGFTYLRLTTNGQFNPDILYDADIQKLNTITFSIDGHTGELNDNVRSGTTLNKMLANIKVARKLGYDVRVNTTITSANIDFIIDIINLVAVEGASQINLNIVYLKGAAANHPELEVDPKQWHQIYQRIQTASSRYPIEIKIPLGYVRNNNEIIQQGKNKCMCLAKKVSRLYIMPDGKASPCLLLMENKLSGLLKDIACAVDNNETFIPVCPLLPMIKGYLPLCMYFKERLNPQYYNNGGT